MLYKLVNSIYDSGRIKNQEHQLESLGKMYRNCMSFTAVALLCNIPSTPGLQFSDLSSSPYQTILCFCKAIHITSDPKEKIREKSTYFPLKG